MSIEQLPIYDMSICSRMTLQAQGLSNAGGNGSNRLMARRQLLSDGTETDAWSGNIFKHHHAMLLIEHCQSLNIPLCDACTVLDSRRVAALSDSPDKIASIEYVLNACAVCDTHGFLVTAKNQTLDSSEGRRHRLSKHSLIEFSMALALPHEHYETEHIKIRVGDAKETGQMLLKVPSRSGTYAQCIRYRGVGVGVDTDKWRIAVSDKSQRIARHQAILLALRAQFLSLEGALTATMVPHVTGLTGAVVVQTTVGRAPLYSALEADFVEQLQSFASDTCSVFPFQTMREFSTLMDYLIKASVPALPGYNRD